MLLGCQVKNFELSYLIKHCLRTIRVQFPLSSIGDEDFQRFTLTLLCSNFAYYFADNASGATTTTNINYTHPRTIRVQYFRILLSSFEEEEF